MHNDLTSLLLVVGLAFLVPILLQYFKLRVIPVVVAEIFVGLLIGSSGFNLIEPEGWVSQLSTLGLIFLMFLSGLELDVSLFKPKKQSAVILAHLPKDHYMDELSIRKPPNPLLLSSVVFVLIVAVSFGCAQLLQQLHYITEPYLFTIMIASISLGVVVPVLKEKKLLDHAYGQTLLMITILSDLITMILLGVYISLQSGSTNSLWLLGLFFVLVFVVYRFASRFMRSKLITAISGGTAQLGTRAIFALILMLVVASETLGVESILGAFLAGVIVSLLRPSRELVHQLESFGYGFLIPIFFIMVGVTLNIPALITDWKIVLLIPLLSGLIFVARYVPTLLLGYWFRFKYASSGGLLMTSTLSLVIAAASVAYDLGIISAELQGAVILVCVINCLLFPVLFNKQVPRAEAARRRVSLIGANHITLPVSQDLLKDGYEIKIYSADASTGDETSKQDYGRFPLIAVSDLHVDTLLKAGAFNTDVIVFGSMDEQHNAILARQAQSFGLENMIVRAESPDLIKSLQDEGFNVFSTLFASRMLLQGLIQYPSAVMLLSQDDSLQEVRMNNPHYANAQLKELPFLGDALILRIYRGESIIIPHGATQLLPNDRLLVSGSPESIQALKAELE
ncbi:monovalent cation:proton antiporter family protein [Paenibacillus sp. J5C_2022]|uniref:monovalent cation:proton antiporter family protein n=1 Tax=Paenibacillus sp. J5C2022 TaxID=2977129 RepID=UPI0021CE972F|nr:monovalent cation:proton antiporter family protein [Paenibacillus sp. J5C2022]MCU6712852.1 monovalent cation:proton antiporter family protein [Paenibacillus sp. J5C2022]